MANVNFVIFWQIKIFAISGQMEILTFLANGNFAIFWQIKIFRFFGKLKFSDFSAKGTFPIFGKWKFRDLKANENFRFLAKF